MGEVTRIEWCDHTFNPWIGCTKVSPGCTHCYAERQNQHYKWNGGSWGPGAPRRVTSESNWAQLRVWNRKAQRAGWPARVFTASLADVFDETAPVWAQWRLWTEIEACPHLEFLLLTKRPQFWREHIPVHWRTRWPHNVRLGFTAENQQCWDERYEIAADFWRRVPGIRALFVSCEPLLGPIEFYPQTTGYVPPPIGWVIAGGESGPGARPMQAGWVRSIRDQCKAARVPFFFKQWGEWQPTTDPEIATARGIPLETCMSYVGKKAAGCLLDGHEHKEFPAAIEWCA